MIDDLKTFIKEHRNIIYIVLLVLIVDRFFLNGKLTERIKGMIEKMLGGIEKKLDAHTETPAIK